MPYSHWTALPAKTYLPILEQISFIIIQLDLFTPRHTSFWWQYNVFPVIFNTQYKTRQLMVAHLQIIYPWLLSLPPRLSRYILRSNHIIPNPNSQTDPPAPRPNKCITLNLLIIILNTHQNSLRRTLMILQSTLTYPITPWVLLAWQYCTFHIITFVNYDTFGILNLWIGT